MDMPGVKQEDISVDVDGSVVRVACEYKARQRRRIQRRARAEPARRRFRTSG
jgi:HSP20 family molecular chaperone IbpA